MENKLKTFEDFNPNKSKIASELTPEDAQWLISMINKDQNGELSNYPYKMEMFSKLQDIVDRFKI